MRFYFLVPGLLDSPSPQKIRELAPALATLLARASVAPERSYSLESWIAQRFSQVENDETFPLAAIASCAEQIADSSAANWLRADPVHLSVNRDRVVLLDASQLEITIAESKALILSMQMHFANDGLTFSAPDPNRWYVASDKPIAIRTHPVSHVRGRNVANYWFDGVDRALWQTRLSEIQMLLHAHPVNEAREAAGQLAINGMWFWGEGKAPNFIKHDYTQIVANNVLIAGIAKLTATRFIETSQFRWDEVTPRRAENTLAVLDQLDVSAAYGEWQAWQTALMAMDQNWFAPAYAALKKGQLTAIKIYAPNKEHGKTFSISRIDQLKFWRRLQIT